MYTVLLLLLALFVTGFVLLSRNPFGAKPEGERLERMKESKNYLEGKFHNLSHTPPLTEGYSYPGLFFDFFFGKKERREPLDSIPSIRTNLHNLPKDRDLLVWFGHSSYLLQLDGRTILVDPVLEGSAAPYSWMNKAFKGAGLYKVEDLPEIDYLLITHDHYDHLDYKTIKKLQGKVGKVVCALGVGAHFEKWGFDQSKLIEEDWDAEVKLEENLKLYFTPARHFSGRSLNSNNTLWTSYVLESQDKRIFVGGDSGYDTHFAAIGKRFGSFDLAILENGQYNEAWRYIHTMPEEVLQAAEDLQARRLFPVHSGKFTLAKHPWNEPLARISKYNVDRGQQLVTPRIGEVVDLDNEQQQFTQWWEGLE